LQGLAFIAFPEEVLQDYSAVHKGDMAVKCGSMRQQVKVCPPGSEERDAFLPSAS
jgi:hypothetical protein